MIALGPHGGKAARPTCSFSWQHESERGPVSRARLHLDAAAQQPGEPVGDVETEARAPVFARQATVELREWLEQTLHVAFGDADAGVLDGKTHICAVNAE